MEHRQLLSLDPLSTIYWSIAYGVHAPLAKAMPRFTFVQRLRHHVLFDAVAHKSPISFQRACIYLCHLSVCPGVSTATHEWAIGALRDIGKPAMWSPVASAHCPLCDESTLSWDIHAHLDVPLEAMKSQIRQAVTDRQQFPGLKRRRLVFEEEEEDDRRVPPKKRRRTEATHPMEKANKDDNSEDDTDSGDLDFTPLVF